MFIKCASVPFSGIQRKPRCFWCTRRKRKQRIQRWHLKFKLQNDGNTHNAADLTIFNIHPFNSAVSTNFELSVTGEKGLQINLPGTTGVRGEHGFGGDPGTVNTNRDFVFNA